LRGRRDILACRFHVFVLLHLAVSGQAQHFELAKVLIMAVLRQHDPGSKVGARAAFCELRQKLK